MQALKAEVEGLPGVVSVAGAAKLPLRGNGNNFDIAIEGRPDVSGATTYFRHVSLDYFRTMGMRIVDGRDFNSSDSFNGEMPIVVNEALAKKYFPGQTAVGKMVSGGYGPARAADRRRRVERGRRESSPMSSSRRATISPERRSGPYRRFPSSSRRRKVPIPPSSSRGSPRSREGHAGPRSPRRHDDVARARPGGGPGAASDGPALDPVRARGPAWRDRHLRGHLPLRVPPQADWAIQIALGRTAPEVVRQVVGQGAVLTAAGIVIGAIGIIGLGRLLGSFLYQTSSMDPLAFAIASIVVLLIGVAAAFVPAWRAGAVDPARALREQ